MEFSDTTVTHFYFHKAGITSFYGTLVLVGFAKNSGMHQKKNSWTSQHLDWFDRKNQLITRKLEPYTKWHFLQGDEKIQGQLLGGCIDVLEFLKDTNFWVSAEKWKGK